MSTSRNRLKVLVEVAIMVALTAVLSQIALFKMPQGGTVTAGSMVPILLIGLRHGVRWGLVAGILAGLVNYIISPYYVHFVQVLLDYPIAFGMLGLAGLAAGKSETVSGLIGAFALFGRLVAHVLSGVIFFAEYAGDQNVWVYSITYNGAYMVPELLISATLLIVLLPVLRKAIPTPARRGAA